MTIPPPLGPAPLPAPYNLIADAGNGIATLFWSIERCKDQAIAGYNIYLVDNISSADAIAWAAKPGAPYNLAPYPGDTKGDLTHQSFALENLVNGRIYFAIVKTIGINLAESNPSNMITFMPLARGSFTISDNHSAGDGGYSFDNEKSVSAYDPSCDIYLYSNGAKVGLSSPNRLTPGMRKSNFSSGLAGSRVDDTIIISQGDTLVVNIKYGWARLKIDNIYNQAEETLARISYTYIPYKLDSDK